MPNWHLEDIYGQLHVGHIVPISRNDTSGMRWEKALNWSQELLYARRDGRKIFKIIDDNGAIQGGISLSEYADHVYIHLIESATHNRDNPRQYVNVARLLIAFAGYISSQCGGDWFIALKPKSHLYDYYYNRYRAQPLLNGKVGIADAVTKYWFDVYYK